VTDGTFKDDAEVVLSPDSEPLPRHTMLSPPVFEFTTSMVTVCENIGAVRASLLVEQMRALTTELRSAVQRRANGDIIRITIALSAMSLLLFLAATPHYQVEDPNGESETQGPKENAEAGAQEASPEAGAGTVLDRWEDEGGKGTEAAGV
jgi:hypothetical protein